MDHYFTDNRHLAENRKETSFWFQCFNVSFITDNGMFPKDGIDSGARILLNTPYEHGGELGNQLLDTGYDYGVMGIVTKKVWPDKQVRVVDVNSRAVESVRDNAEKNSTEANIHVLDVYEQVSGDTFTDIITNPPIRAGKNVIYNIFEEAWNHLVDQGTFWIVVRKQQGVHSAMTKIKEVFGNYNIIHKEKGCFMLKTKRVPTI